MTAPQLSEPLRQLLREIPATIPAERIDRLWLFAPRDLNGKESGLVVLSLQATDDERPDHRLVVTWRYEARTARGKIIRTDDLAEQGSAPADRIDRLIEGVIARLGDEAENPIGHTIGRDPARWTALLESLGASDG